MLTFWFDRGVEGIRVDAVPVLGKHPDMPDAPPAPPGLTDAQAWRHNSYAHFHPSAHDVWKRWRTVIDKYEADHPGRHLFMISESYGPPEVTLLAYMQGDEFHQNVRLRPDVDHVAGEADPRRDHRFARHARRRSAGARRGRRTTTTRSASSPASAASTPTIRRRGPATTWCTSMRRSISNWVVAGHVRSITVDRGAARRAVPLPG